MKKWKSLSLLKDLKLFSSWAKVELSLLIKLNALLWNHCSHFSSRQRYEYFFFSDGYWVQFIFSLWSLFHSIKFQSIFFFFVSPFPFTWWLSHPHHYGSFIVLALVLWKFSHPISLKKKEKRTREQVYNKLFQMFISVFFFLHSAFNRH